MRPEQLVDALISGIVHDVPDGSSWDDVHRWLHRLDPARNGWLGLDDAERHLDALCWIRITATEAFWVDDARLLTAATAALSGALWQLGLPCGVRTSGGPEGVAISLGTTPSGAAALGRLVRAFLPGCTLGPEGTSGPPAVPTGWSPLQRAALWGTAPMDGSMAAESLLGRLARLGDTRWQLQALLIPVAAEDLNDRAGRLSALAATIAGHANHQVMVDDLVTATIEDPEATRMLAGIADERERVASGIRTGSWAAVAWLESTSEEDLAAAVGAATAPEATSSPPPNAAAPGRPQVGWMPIVGDHAPPSLLTTREAGELLRPPFDDRLGLPSRRWVSLDRHPEPLPGRDAHVELGLTEDGAPLAVPIDALTSHALITGSPGAGKTSTVFSLLAQLADHDVPFTVIEPIKQEYAGLPVGDLTTWRPAAPEAGTDWILNPLEVPDGVSAQSHIERIVALARSTMGLTTPLPGIIELGMRAVYRARGWDIEEDRAPASAGAGWPTLTDLIAVCADLPAKLGYPPEIQANLRAAILARLGTLTGGPRARVLDRDGTFPMAEFLASRVVVNLDEFGSDEARAFFMGLLLVRLREAFAGSSEGRLAHVLVIEEAHRLLADAPAPAGDPTEVGGGGGAHTAGEIANLLAEIRSTGEGVVVVDQSPSSLVPAVLANTSTKVALRADARRDQVALASAMGLDDRDAHVLGASRRHEALVAWEGMDRPIRARLHHRHPTPRRNAAPAARRPARRLTDPSPAIASEVRTLVRSTGPDARASRARLDRLVAAELGADHHDLIRTAVEDLIEAEVDALGRARGWAPDARRAARRAVLAGAEDGHPAHLLVDGRLPLPSCRAACPHGGCLFGEPAGAEATRLRAEGPATIVRLVADPEERRRRVARRAIAVTGTEAPDHLQRLAAACVTVHAFDDWADPDTVAALVGPTPRPIDGPFPGTQP